MAKRWIGIVAAAGLATGTALALQPGGAAGHAPAASMTSGMSAQVQPQTADACVDHLRYEGYRITEDRRSACRHRDRLCVDVLMHTGVDRWVAGEACVRG